jgi:hypothetical protein
MKPAIWAVLPAFALVVPASAATPREEDKPAAAVSQQTDAVEPAKACKKKKKGLGGLLRAARSSGLISVVAGKAGTGGALVNSAANTAIDVADATNRMAPPVEKPKC